MAASTTAERTKLNWSSSATTRCVLELLRDLDWRTAEVCDVGAGRGHFTRELGAWLRAEHGLDAAGHLVACDAVPASFQPDAIECLPVGDDGRLPFEDDRFDVVVSIEVIEHVEDQFAFLRELVRVARPGGRVIVTTPNVLNVNSRLRTLLWGFPLLFDPLPLEDGDGRILGGHIHPVGPYFLAWGALRVGLERPRFHSDRTKVSAAILATLLWPLLALSRAKHRARLRRKRPELLAANAELLRAVGGWGLLTARTTVLEAWKPGR